jgi:hypothetical protein
MFFPGVFQQLFQCLLLIIIQITASKSPILRDAFADNLKWLPSPVHILFRIFSPALLSDTVFLFGCLSPVS